MSGDPPVPINSPEVEDDNSVLQAIKERVVAARASQPVWVRTSTVVIAYTGRKKSAHLIRILSKGMRTPADFQEHEAVLAVKEHGLHHVVGDGHRTHHGAINLCMKWLPIRLIDLSGLEEHGIPLTIHTHDKFIAMCVEFTEPRPAVWLLMEQVQNVGVLVDMWHRKEEARVRSVLTSSGSRATQARPTRITAPKILSLFRELTAGKAFVGIEFLESSDKRGDSYLRKMITGALYVLEQGLVSQLADIERKTVDLGGSGMIPKQLDRVKSVSKADIEYLIAKWKRMLGRGEVPKLVFGTKKGRNNDGSDDEYPDEEVIHPHRTAPPRTDVSSAVVTPRPPMTIPPVDPGWEARMARESVPDTTCPPGRENDLVGPPGFQVTMQAWCDRKATLFEDILKLKTSGLNRGDIMTEEDLKQAQDEAVWCKALEDEKCRKAVIEKTVATLKAGNTFSLQDTMTAAKEFIAKTTVGAGAVFTGGRWKLHMELPSSSLEADVASDKMLTTDDLAFMLNITSTWRKMNFDEFMVDSFYTQGWFDVPYSGRPHRGCTLLKKSVRLNALLKAKVLYIPIYGSSHWSAMAVTHFDSVVEFVVAEAKGFDNDEHRARLLAAKNNASVWSADSCHGQHEGVLDNAVDWIAHVITALAFDDGDHVVNASEVNFLTVKRLVVTQQRKMSCGTHTVFNLVHMNKIMPYLLDTAHGKKGSDLMAAPEVYVNWRKETISRIFELKETSVLKENYTTIALPWTTCEDGAGGSNPATEAAQVAVNRKAVLRTQPLEDTTVQNVPIELREEVTAWARRIVLNTDASGLGGTERRDRVLGHLMETSAVTAFMQHCMRHGCDVMSSGNHLPYLMLYLVKQAEIMFKKLAGPENNLGVTNKVRSRIAKRIEKITDSERKAVLLKEMEDLDGKYKELEAKLEE